MKLSEAWLREWVNPSITREALCDTLTMAGLEIDSVEPVASPFSNVVIGRILETTPHQTADNLQVCEVDVGQSKTLSIVCGANNARAELITAVALPGAALPNDLNVQATTIRGQASAGMLCSAKELGISDDHSGLLELPLDAPIGKNIREYLMLDDYLLDVSITPNRGDCLSVRGMAREVSTLTRAKLNAPVITPVPATHSDTLNVTLSAPAGCPQYVGRLIKNVKVDQPTPIWLKERLRQSGIRSINVIVDITNYVMLELGQPMHAFDLGAIHDAIEVRFAQPGETLTLLDGKEATLNDKTVIIADTVQPLAIGGVIGGARSGVTLLTKHIFLESAYFPAATVAYQRQHYQCNTEAAFHYERGVDPTIQSEAIERATQLILELAGGQPGPTTPIQATEHLPAKRVITLKHDKIARLLGLTLSEETVKSIFTAFSFEFEKINDTWQVTVPPYRFDIERPEDLIEELARAHGYIHIPTHEISGNLILHPLIKEQESWRQLRTLLANQSYHEIVSYSFVDPKIQTALHPLETSCQLVNPISSEMSVMRTNLLPGLITTLKYNLSRQQERVRLFEIGRCFHPSKQGITQPHFLGGLITGTVSNEQWGDASRQVDFYDLKGDVENVLSLLCPEGDFVIQKNDHPALHPGQSAAYYLNDKEIGIMGTLHPSLAKSLDLPKLTFIFQFNLEMFNLKPTLPIQAVSKFPEIRRDLALLVNDTIPAEAISDTIKLSAGDWLKDVFIFDVYQGKNIQPGIKSIALALLLQHPTRTLVDEEVTNLISHVVKALKDQLGAELRS